MYHSYIIYIYNMLLVQKKMIKKKSVVYTIEAHICIWKLVVRTIIIEYWLKNK